MSSTSAAVLESEAFVQVASVKLGFLGEGVTNRRLRDETLMPMAGVLGVG